MTMSKTRTILIIKKVKTVFSNKDKAVDTKQKINTFK